MRSHSWGLIAAAGLIIGAVLLGIGFIWQGGPQDALPVIDAGTEVLDMTPSPSPAPSPTPTKPVTYTIQPGDTLSALAQDHDTSVEALVEANNLVNPDVLQVGQVLVIPRHDDATSPAVASTAASSPSSELEAPALIPTLTPSGPPLMEISGITAAGRLEAEVVTVSNEGGTVSLEGWILAGQIDDPFTFPAITLFPGGTVRVHSKEGEDSPRDLYWGRLEPAWTIGGLVTLRDGDGNVVDTYIVPD